MKLLFVLLFLVASLPATVAAPAVALSTAPRPAPAVAALSSVPAGGYPDAFPYGQCTWWAAYNRRVSWGGNAGDWLTNAAAQGLAVSATPSVGAIAVYRPGRDYSRYGHVALVVAVGPGTYTVSEMNYSGWAQVDIRTLGWPDPNLEGFIPLPEEKR